MIGFTDQHRKTYRVRREEGAEYGDPYGFIIPGTHGHLYVHGPDTFGVATHKAGGIARQIRRLPFVTVVQAGDDGINATFPAEHLKTVARLVKAYRRPRLTPEQRAALAERAKELNQKGLNPRLERKNGSSIDPARQLALGILNAEGGSND